MRSKVRCVVVVLAIGVPIWGSMPGCTQADNPAPEKAAPPPPAKPEELAVPKKGPTGQTYGGGDRYKKAMERLNKPGG